MPDEGATQTPLKWSGVKPIKKDVPDAPDRIRMVDISGKPETERVAVACGTVFMRQATLDRIRAGEIEKGDVLAVARTAGIMGAKKTPDVIPLCHPLLLAAVSVQFATEASREGSSAEIQITATVKSLGQTGVEMEAMTAVCVAALTVYDMCKGIDPSIHLGQIGLVEKWGGKSGHYLRPPGPADGGAPRLGHRPSFPQSDGEAHRTHGVAGRHRGLSLQSEGEAPPALPVEGAT